MEGGAPKEPSLWVRAMASLLILYPPGFRESLGGEMVHVFGMALRERRGRGRSAVWWYGTVTLMATVCGGVRERIHEARRRRVSAGKGRRASMGDEFRGNLTTLVRQLRGNPSFAAVVVLTLALGIGVTTAVFSVVRGVLLSPLPYPESAELVHLTRAGAASLPNIQDLADRLESMEELGGAFVPSVVTLTGVGDPVQLQRSYVTANFFRILGVEPAVGRWLGPADVGTARAVVNYRLWRTRFGGDPGVVGRVVVLNEEPVEVVGVAPPQIGPPFDVDFWQALPWGPGEGARGSRGWRAVEPYGRLAAGRTLDEARQELATEWERLAAEYPDADGRWHVGIQTVKAQVTGDEETPLKLVFGAATLFLLIACANVASIFLARLDGRRQEFAVRSSLGAGRLRLLRQAWTEALVLSLLGGILGIGIAAVGVEWGVARMGAQLSRADQVTLNGGVLAFALLASLATATVVGLITVLAWGREEPAQALRRLGSAVAGRTGLLRRSLVIAEVALALMMVTGMGLLVRSFQKVQDIDVGVQTQGVIAGSLGRFSSSRYPDGTSRNALLDRLQERIRAVPGVEDVAVASHLPLGGCCSNRPFHLGDDPERTVNGVEVRWVTPNYFDLLGIPILAGKDFADLGPDDPDGVAINQVMAQALFGDEDPLGTTVASEGFGEAQVWAVSGSVREFSPEQAPPPMVYVSSRQGAMSGGFLLLRTSLPAQQVVPAVRKALADVDPLLPLDRIQALDQVLAGYNSDRRATTMLMVLLGALALLLGVIGIYGVMSHAVQGRVREIGVRLALGATREEVYGRTLRGALVLILPGILLGAVGALVSRRFVESLLYDVSSLDPLVYVSVLVVFTLAALAAAAGPARRAARVDVVEILKES